MSDLAAWLLEQIAEDERVANDARNPNALDYVWHTGDGADPGEVHLVRWQPLRVLAECEVKRLLVEEFDSCGDLLKILARPYADQPGYDEAWRP